MQFRFASATSTNAADPAGAPWLVVAAVAWVMCEPVLPLATSAGQLAATPAAKLAVDPTAELEAATEGLGPATPAWLEAGTAAVADDTFDVHQASTGGHSARPLL